MTSFSRNAEGVREPGYFQAGTEVVWDVDTMVACIHVYRVADPEHAVTYRRGEMAEAEPAALGLSVAVDWIFAGKPRNGANGDVSSPRCLRVDRRLRPSTT